MWPACASALLRPGQVEAALIPRTAILNLPPREPKPTLLRESPGANRNLNRSDCGGRIAAKTTLVQESSNVDMHAVDAQG